MKSSETTRPAYHHGDLRRTLIAFALRRVRSGGAQEFSLREAARAAGVTSGAAYRHFDDKQALLRAVADVGFRLLAKRTLKASETLRGADRLHAVGKAYVAFASREPWLFRLMFSLVGAAGPTRTCLARPDPPSSLAQLRDALQETAGEIGAAATDDLVSMAWTVAHGAASLICDGMWGRDDPRADAALKRFVDFVSRTALVKPESATQTGGSPHEAL